MTKPLSSLATLPSTIMSTVLRSGVSCQPLVVILSMPSLLRLTSASSSALGTSRKTEYLKSWLETALSVGATIFFKSSQRVFHSNRYTPSRIGFGVVGSKERGSVGGLVWVGASLHVRGV